MYFLVVKVEGWDSKTLFEGRMRIELLILEEFLHLVLRTFHIEQMTKWWYFKTVSSSDFLTQSLDHIGPFYKIHTVILSGSFLISNLVLLSNHSFLFAINICQKNINILGFWCLSQKNGSNIYNRPIVKINLRIYLNAVFIYL